MQPDNRTKVGTCFHCGKRADYNTPALDPTGNLWCNHCVDDDRSDIMFTSIDQFKIDNKYQVNGGVVFNGVVVWEDLTTWTDGGSRSVILTEEEKKLSPKEIALLLNEEHNIRGLTRCTGCGTKMTKDQIAGYPLFAGVCCTPCMDKHKIKLDKERKSGHVCRRCHQPYGNCCC